jgi:spermidine synthase
MQHLGLRQISLLLAFAAVLTGILVLFFSNAQFTWPPAWAAALAVAALVSIGLAPRLYTLFYERLTFGAKPQANIPFAQIVENRNAVIAVTQDGAVFGSGVYDGHFRIDPNYDLNLVVRAFVLSAYNPAPKRMLMIGLSSGSWAQIFVNHPRLESMDIVEINPGYLDLIPRYPVVSSLLTNPRAASTSTSAFSPMVCGFSIFSRSAMPRWASRRSVG